MCLLAIGLWNHPRYRLILAANRDEFLERPTRGLEWWPEAPHLLAGKDLRGGGTWLGITRQGRLAALTNHRDPARIKPRAPSRGHLVSDFLKGAETPRAYVHRIRKRGAEFNGFNLVVGDLKQILCYSNVDDRLRPLTRGVYGLSNALLDTPWPKTEKLKSALGKVIRNKAQIGLRALSGILQNTSQAPHAELPRTGVELAWERQLSSVFVCAPGYGTRSSSVITMAHGGRVTFSECTYTFHPSGAQAPTPRIQKARTRWFTVDRRPGPFCGSP